MTAVLLAAGESSRMGRPKALLPFDRSTFSRSVLLALQKGGCADCLVVVGHDPGPIVAHLGDLGPRFVMNRRWKFGQITSLQAAIRASSSGASAILVALVDQPGLRAATVGRLLRVHARHPSRILIASCRGRGGHPVLFPRRFFPALLDAPLTQGARAVVQKNASDRLYIETGDPAVVRDVDTPSEFKRLSRRPVVL